MRIGGSQIRLESLEGRIGRAIVVKVRKVKQPELIKAAGTNALERGGDPLGRDLQ